MEAQLDSLLLKRGVDSVNVAWLKKCLHPAGEYVANGVPDLNAEYVVRPEYRVQSVLTGPSTAMQYDLLLWMPPGDANAFYWAAAPSPANFQAAGAPPVGATGGVVPLLGMTRVSGPAGQAWFSVATGVVSTFSQMTNSQQPLGFRTMYRSITAYLTASAIADQGTVFATQLSSRHTVGPRCVDGSLGDGTYAGITDYAVFNHPWREDLLVQLTPDPYVAAARAGVYVPSRLEGPAQPFAVGDRFDQYAVGTTPAVNTRFIESFGSSLAGTTFPQRPINTAGTYFGQVLGPGSNTNWSFWPNTLWLGPQAPGGFGATSLDSAFDNVTTSIVIFRNLTGPGTATGGASVTVKVLVGLEVIPTPDSPNITFIRPPMMPSSATMLAYYALVCDLEDAYPASYNSLGTLISEVAGVAKRVWPAIRTGLDVLFPMPASSPAQVPVASRARVAYLGAATPSTSRAAPRQDVVTLYKQKKKKTKKRKSSR